MNKHPIVTDTSAIPYFVGFADRARLFHGDCVALLSRVLDEDPPRVIFADPPYFLSDGGITCHAGRMTSVNKGDWDVPSTPEEMHRFNVAWLRACKEVMHPDGTIWASGTAHVIHSVGYAMQQLGFKLLNDITWEKPNPPPNISCRYFTHATETIIWAARDENGKHTFNYEAMKRLNGGKQMKSVWRLGAPTKAEKRLGAHPTQKPLALLARLLLASGREGDLVVDPFCGSGTTALAAVGLGMRFAGFEIDQGYLELARSRLLELEQQPHLF